MTDELKTEPRGYISILLPYTLNALYYIVLAFSAFAILTYIAVIVHLNVVEVPAYSGVDIPRRTKDYAMGIAGYVIIIVVLVYHKRWGEDDE